MKAGLRRLSNVLVGFRIKTKPTGTDEGSTTEERPSGHAPAAEITRPPSLRFEQIQRQRAVASRVGRLKGHRSWRRKKRDFVREAYEARIAE